MRKRRDAAVVVVVVVAVVVVAVVAIVVFVVVVVLDVVVVAAAVVSYLGPVHRLAIALAQEAGYLVFPIPGSHKTSGADHGPQVLVTPLPERVPESRYLYAQQNFRKN